MPTPAASKPAPADARQFVGVAKQPGGRWFYHHQGFLEGCSQVPLHNEVAMRLNTGFSAPDNFGRGCILFYSSSVAHFFSGTIHVRWHRTAAWALRSAKMFARPSTPHLVALHSVILYGVTQPPSRNHHLAMGPGNRGLMPVTDVLCGFPSSRACAGL